MANIYLTINQSSREVSIGRSFAGVQLENLQDNFVVKFNNGFVDGTAYMEYEVNGESYYIEMTKNQETYTLPIEQVLISEEGIYPFQVRIQNGNSIFKSKIFYLKIYPSINAQDFPPSYQSWKDWVIEYVDENGGAINVVQQNGVDLPITNKTVNVETPLMNNEPSQSTKDGYSAKYINDLFANLRIGTNNLQDNSISESKVQNGAITNSKLANNSVSTDKILNGAITADKIYDNSITSAKLANDAISTNKVQNEAITEQKLSQELQDKINNSGVSDYNDLSNKPIDNIIENINYQEGGYYKKPESFGLTKFFEGQTLTLPQDKIYVDRSKESELLQWMRDKMEYDNPLSAGLDASVMIQLSGDSAIFLIKNTIVPTHPIYMILSVMDNAKVWYASDSGSIPELNLSWDAGFNLDNTIDDYIDWYDGETAGTLTIRFIRYDTTFWNGKIFGSNKYTKEGDLVRYENSELNARLFDSNLVVDLGVIQSWENGQSQTRTISNDDLELLKNNETAYVKFNNQILDNNINISTDYYFKKTLGIDYYARDLGTHRYMFYFTDTKEIISQGIFSVIIENTTATIQFDLPEKITVNDIDSGTATAGQIPTADGNGGTSWQDPSGGHLYQHNIYVGAYSNPNNICRCKFTLINNTSTAYTSASAVNSAIDGFGQIQATGYSINNNNTNLIYSVKKGNLGLSFYELQSDNTNIAVSSARFDQRGTVTVEDTVIQIL